MEINVGEEAFNERFAECPVLAYYRNERIHSIYNRITDIPNDFNAYSIFTDVWKNYPSNVLNTDFEIYSSVVDMENGTNRWEFCNYVSVVGYPRNCGPTASNIREWFTMPDTVNPIRYITSGAEFKFLDVCSNGTGNYLVSESKY